MHFRGADQENLDQLLGVEEYFAATPSEQYEGAIQELLMEHGWEESPARVWTDGSKIVMPSGAECVGAGVYAEAPATDICFREGGEAKGKWLQ